MLSSLSGPSKQTLRRYLRPWLTPLLQTACPLCDRATPHTFCTDCQRQLEHLWSGSRWHPLQAQSAARPFPSERVCTLGHYSGTLKRAILALKYQGRTDVARPLGMALAQQHQTAQVVVNQHNPPQARPYVIPIPLHTERQKVRGYNQAELLARAFCSASRLPLLPHGLVRSRATLPQHQLGKCDRQQNLHGVFEAGPSLRKLCRSPRRNISVLLLDDIYTTGSTIDSAIAALAPLGIKIEGVLTAAKASL